VPSDSDDSPTRSDHRWNQLYDRLLASDSNGEDASSIEDHEIGEDKGEDVRVCILDL
jgi:hypothetical protein